MLQQAVGLLTVTYRRAVPVSEEEAIGFWNYAISHFNEIESGVLPRSLRCTLAVKVDCCRLSSSAI